MRKLLFILFLCSAPAAATTYYVAKTGSDSNNCSSGSPCLTIQHGINVAAGAGNTLIVSSGTYNESPSVSSGGSSGNPFIIQGFSSSCPQTADSDPFNQLGYITNPNVIVNSFSISASYVRLDCFQSNSTISAGGGTGVDIWDNYVSISPTSNSTGIGFSGSTNLTVLRNYIVLARLGTEGSCSNNCLFQYNNYFKSSQSGTTTGTEYNEEFGNGVTYKQNYMHGNNLANCGGGITQCHEDCLITWNYGTGQTHDITFTQNVCFNIMNGVIAQDRGTDCCAYGSYASMYNWTITNNIFGYDYGANGSGAYNANCLAMEHVGNVKFDNNDCIYGDIWMANGGQLSSVQNNIQNHADHTLNGCPQVILLAPNNGSTIPGQVVTEGHNMFSGPCTVPNTSPYSASDINNTNPRYVNENDCNQYGGSCYQSTSTQSFHLQSSSAAIDAGASISDVTVDLYGTTRPSPPSIGAVEFSAGSAPGVTLSPQSLNFGNVNVGASSSPQTVTLTNSGNATLTVSANAFTTGTQYSVTTDCGSVSFNLGAGASCHYNFTFSPLNPSGIGTDADTYSLTDNAAGSPHAITMTGVGVNPNGITVLTTANCTTVSGGATANLTATCAFATSGKGHALFYEIGFLPGYGGNHVTGVNCGVGDTWAQANDGTNAARATESTHGMAEEIWWTNNNVGGQTSCGISVNANSQIYAVGYEVSPNLNAVDKVANLNNGLAGASSPYTATGPTIATTQATEFMLSYDKTWIAIETIGNGCTWPITSPPDGWGYEILSSTGTYGCTWNSSSQGSFAASTAGFYAASSSPPNVQFTQNGNTITGINLGSVFVNNTAQQNVTLTNNGGSALTGPSGASLAANITVSGSSEFTISNNCPASLSASANCSITVRFSPTATGSVTGTVSVADNATGSPHTFSLAGTGINVPAPTNVVATPGGVPIQ